MAIFFVLFFIHLFFSFNNNTLIALPDELGYWGHARYLAGGYHPHFYNAAFYNFGYSLIIWPAFILFRELNQIHQAAVLINNILMALIIFPTYYIVRHIYNCEIKLALAIAFVVSLYPSFLAQTNFIMSENILIPAYLMLIVFLYQWLQKNSLFHLVLFSLDSVFLFAIHPRAVLMPALVVTLLLILIFFKKISKRFFWIGLGTLVFSLGIVVLVNRHLAAVGWSTVNSFNLVKLIPTFFSGTGLLLFFSAIPGQLLYLLIGSFGLFAWGAYYLWKKITDNYGRLSLREILADNKKIAIAFVLFSSLLILMISWVLPIFANANGSLRADHIFYGRYNEGFVIFYLTAGLAALFDKSIKKSYHILWLFLLAWPVNYVYDLLNKLISVSTFNIWAITPLFYLSGQKNIVLVAVFAAMITIALRFSASHNFKVTFFILCTFFLSFAAVNRQMLLEGRQRFYQAADFSTTRYLEKAGDIYQLSFDMSFNGKDQPNWATWYISAYAYQYYLPQIKFEQFYSSKADIPKGPYVLSRPDWSQARALKAEMVFQDDAIGQALWRLPVN